MAKLALVTGGSRGIGACVVAQLRAAGWDVLAPTRAELNFFHMFSVTGYLDESKIERSKVDALVFCHGEWYSRIDQEWVDWGPQYNSRVAYPAYLMRRLSPVMGGGVVVMVSSTRGFIGGIDTGPYSAACAAQIALMQGYAREGKLGIRYNCVAPGLTETDMGQIVKATGGAKPGTVGQPPEAVAAVIVGLVTDGTSNGRVVRVVDGKASDAKWSW